ncbi:MAG: phosphopantothenoylcysteine decarboxylase [Planctomycetota bacterium]
MRLLVTAGPTYEAIDAVRFLGNRSSGRVGAAIADAAARRSLEVRCLIGPHAQVPQQAAVNCRRFRSAEDLERLLAEHLPWCDVLVMAAAVADYRPAAADTGSKLRRSDGPLTLTLEPTPDLLDACARRRRPGQLLVGFALEPETGLKDAARAKLARKGIDLIVANSLETMDADEIDARLLSAPGVEPAFDEPSGRMSKTDFAGWLLDRIALVQGRTNT